MFFSTPLKMGARGRSGSCRKIKIRGGKEAAAGGNLSQAALFSWLWVAFPEGGRLQKSTLKGGNGGGKGFSRVSRAEGVGEQVF